MKITLTPEKVNKITTFISALLVSPSPTIREVAQAIGYIVSSLPAVKYGKCHYRAIENNKISALKEAKGNFDSTIVLINFCSRRVRMVGESLTHFFSFYPSTSDRLCNKLRCLPYWLGWSYE